MKPLRTLFLITFGIFCNQTQLFCQSNNFWEALEGPRDVDQIHLIAQNLNEQLFVVMGDTMFRSPDQGATWIPAVTGLNTTALESGRFFTSRSGQFYFANSYHVKYRYNNTQESWSQVDNQAPLTNNPLGFDIDTTGRFWHVQYFDEEVYYSDDEGGTYTRVFLDTNPIGKVEKIASLDENHQLLWTNQGATSYLYRFDISGKVELIDSGNNLLSYVGFSPYTSTGFYMGYNIYKRSTDGGLTWTELPVVQNGDNLYINEMVFDSTGTIWGFGSDHTRVYRSDDDGLTWKAPPNLIKDKRYFKIPDGDFFEANDNCIGLTFAQSTDEGETWKDLADAFGFPSTSGLIQDAKGSLYVESCRKQGYEWSSDNGQTWSDYVIKDSLDVKLSSLITRTDSFMMAVGQNGKVYRSFNNGVDWQVVSALPFQPTYASYYMRLYQGFQGDIHFFGAKNWYKTTNDGDNWELLDITLYRPDMIDEVLFLPNGDIYINHGDLCLLYKASTGTTEVFAYDVYLLHSTVDGYVYFTKSIVWPLTGELYRIAPNSNYTPEKVLEGTGPFISCTSNNAGDVYVLLNGFLHRSLDNGLNWEAIADMPTYGSNADFYVGFDQHLYACFDNQVVHRSLDGTVSIHVEPSKTDMLKIYPNPFNNQLIFDLMDDQQPGEHTIHLFDALGRAIRREVFYGLKFTMAVGDLHPGVYFYRLDGSSGIEGSGTLYRAE
jgi:photosystem II stability/assembly factor-like uncharacterized protein